MNGTKLGFFSVIILFGATLVASALSTDIATAGNSSMNNPSVVRLLDNQYGYRGIGTSEPRLDTGGPVQYRNVGMFPCSGDCGRCAVRDYDRDASARDCDCPSRCPFVSGYRCDLYSCRWVRDYDCGSCTVK